MELVKALTSRGVMSCPALRVLLPAVPEALRDWPWDELWRHSDITCSFVCFVIHRYCCCVTDHGNVQLRQIKMILKIIRQLRCFYEFSIICLTNFHVECCMFACECDCTPVRLFLPARVITGAVRHASSASQIPECPCQFNVTYLYNVWHLS